MSQSALGGRARQLDGQQCIDLMVEQAAAGEAPGGAEGAPCRFPLVRSKCYARSCLDQARAHFNRNDLKCGYFAASTCPAEEGRSQAPWRSKIACNSAIGTARVAQPRVAAKAASAACPVSQHCGISRRKEWLDG